MLDELANMIADTNELTTLAVRGLKMDSIKVSKAINNNKSDITGASRVVLSDWRKKEKDPNPYNVLVKALEHVGLNLYITKTLK